MLTCLGLRADAIAWAPGGTIEQLRATGAARVHAAAYRLVAGTVTLVRPYAAQLASVAGTDFAAALADGRLDRYLAQTRPTGVGRVGSTKERYGTIAHCARTRSSRSRVHR